MRSFTITYRKKYFVEYNEIVIEAYNFANAEDKFNNDFQEEDDLIITKISLNE